MSQLTVQAAAALLRERDGFLILTHRRPDGDTTGCAAGLCLALRRLGKTAWVLRNPETTDNNLTYVRDLWAPEGYEPGFVVSVDVAARGLFYPEAEAYFDRIGLAVDHHPSFEGFGTYQCVDPARAACGEIVCDICRELGPLTAEIALPLYAAVATDTGCFAYANTTPRTHRVAAALMETGIDYQAVNKVFFRTKTRKRMQLEGAMLSDCEFYDRGRVAVLSVPISLMERFQATESDAEDLSALGPQIQGVDCAITLRELREDVWKISLRTGERINATRACGLLGGGGHAAAAGCTVEAPWAEVKRRILDAVAQTAPDFSAN